MMCLFSLAALASLPALARGTGDGAGPVGPSIQLCNQVGQTIDETNERGDRTVACQLGFAIIDADTLFWHFGSIQYGLASPKATEAFLQTDCSHPNPNPSYADALKNCEAVGGTVVKHAETFRPDVQRTYCKFDGEIKSKIEVWTLLKGSCSSPKLMDLLTNHVVTFVDGRIAIQPK